MNEIPIGVLFGALAFLIILSGFFSGSETGLISLNRYRLKNLVKNKHKGAVRASKLLERPDRLIGLILLGNNFVNILASSIATIIALRLMGESGIAIAAGLLTLVILIFSEVAPKTLAALHPERFAFPASLVLGPLLIALYPLVWIVNIIANSLLKILGVPLEARAQNSLSREELRTVVNEAGAMIPQQHQKMLVSILDLETVTVEDIMIPRNEIAGIDINDEWEKIVQQLATTQHTRLPVYQGDISNSIGFIHMRNAAQVLSKSHAEKEELMKVVRDTYFIPESTPLHTQLLNFQRHKRRSGLVVDEYGDILGLVTLEDILEEIVGDFTTDPSTTAQDVYPQEDGSFMVDGGCHTRDLNKTMKWELPTDGPKTLSGLIIEHMEAIPEPGTSLMIAGYPIDIIQTKGNVVKVARINPHIRQAPRIQE